MVVKGGGRSWVVWIAGILGLVFLRSPRAAEWLALALIIFAGIPHGAFDLRVAEQIWGRRGRSRWFIGAIYCGIGAVMSLLCLLLPSVGLGLFLLISLVHFAEGEGRELGRVAGGLVALGSIVLPIAFHVESAGPYLAFFVSPLHFSVIAPALWWGAVVIATALVLVAFWLGRADRGTDALEIAVCLSAWCILSPLAGFAVWFIGRHSRHHLAVCRANFAGIKPLFAPDFLIVSAVAIALLLPFGLRFDLRVIEELFAASIVLIAGLTLPHMVVTHLFDSARAKKE